MAKGETYLEFVTKFEPKKTTDDCYTPPEIYDEIADWVANRYGLDRENFVRPFYHGGDFYSFEYCDSSVVVDNPPFSILSEIQRWYCRNGIKFFLFAPALTLLSSIQNPGVSAICACVSITYENGANVNTSFVTNLEPVPIVCSCPELNERIEIIDKIIQARDKKHVPKYDYPDELLTAGMLNYMSNHGTDFCVKRSETAFVRALDKQRLHGKGVFGGGFLLSKKAAAEKAAAEKAAAEKAAAHVWELSGRERLIVEELSDNSEDNGTYFERALKRIEGAIINKAKTLDLEFA